MFDEELFLQDLSEDPSTFSVSQMDVEADFYKWSSILMRQLNKHAPVKTKRVKTKHMPVWFIIDITTARKYRDLNKKEEKLAWVHKVQEPQQIAYQESKT